MLEIAGGVLLTIAWIFVGLLLLWFLVSYGRGIADLGLIFGGFIAFVALIDGSLNLLKQSQEIPIIENIIVLLGFVIIAYVIYLWIEDIRLRRTKKKEGESTIV